MKIPLGAILLGTSLALPGFPTAAAAEVYRCTTAAGKIEFRDVPCDPQQSSAVIDARPNTLDRSAVREQLLRIENRELRDRLATREPAPAVAMQGSVAPSRADSADCRSARRDLEIATSSIDRNRALVRARTSAMHVACGVPEPERHVTEIRVDRPADRAGRSPPSAPGR